MHFVAPRSHLIAKLVDRCSQNLFGVNPSTGYAYLGDAANAQGLDDLFAPGAVAAVPEPQALALWLAGLGAVGLRVRRRLRRG